MVFRHLGHSGITHWDEVFHAVVARNLTKHPFTFTLYDQPWLLYDYKDWTENHIWLHKPPVALWAIWFSHLIFGINTFALRLPSAISLVVTAWLTYRIATDLFDKRAGVIAAFLHGFNPFLFESVQGYRFADHIDMALLLWVQVSCWFLLRAIRTGKRRNYILSGVATGVAYLSKSYLACITLCIALVVWCVARGKQIYYKKYAPEDGGPNQPIDENIRLSDLGFQLLAAIATVAPWTLHCLIYYREEFLWEHKRVLAHLNAGLETWGGPWDRHLFDFMPFLLYPIFYVPVVVAVLSLIIVMFRRWQLAEVFVVAWGLGVIVPHTLAATKTPSATMLAMPPLLMCLAAVISRTWQKNDWIYTVLMTSAMLTISVFPGSYILIDSDSLSRLRTFAPFVVANSWILQQLLGCGILLTIFTVCHQHFFSRKKKKWMRFGIHTLGILIAFLHAGYYIKAAYEITERNREIPLYEISGQHLQNVLPQNACLFLDDHRSGAHLELMYYADRSTYQIYTPGIETPRDWVSDAEKARKAGAIPYLFSMKETMYDYPLFLEGDVVVSRGKVVRYRVFEIAEPRNE